MSIINITGASGFVGQNLVQYLTSKLFTVNQLSLRDNNWQAAINKEADAIIHLAGKAHDTKNTSQSSEYFNINTDLTIQLFDAFLKSENRDFIYFSSVKAVADEVVGVLTEDAIPSPKTPYGESKHKAEQYLLSKQLPPNKRLFIIRPCMIHGEGNKGNLNLLYKVVQKGIPYVLGKFNNERSFLSIDNLCFIIQHLLTNKTIPSGIYNLADDGFISTNSLIKIIAKAQNKQPKIWYISPVFIGFLAKLGNMLHLPLNTERLKKLTENYRVSNQKIKQVLQIQSLPLSAEDGLLKTIKSFANK